MKSKTLLAVLALILCLTACGGGPEPADLVITGGRIVTLDPAMPEVEAIAARDQRVVAMGGVAEIARYIGDATEVVELDGALAVPGLIEGHGHFTGLGRSRMILDLTTVDDFGRDRRDGGFGGLRGRRRASGFSDAVGTRRNGVRPPNPMSRGFRITTP